VALRDTSSKAFGEYIDFSYHVNGSTLRLSAYGGLSLGFGTEMRISGEPSWSTGNLRVEGGEPYIFRDVNESAAIMFHSFYLRRIVYEVYDINNCGLVDVRESVYPMSLGFENGRLALRVVTNPPTAIYSSTQISERRNLRGIDGRGGRANMLRFSEILINEPLIDVSGNVRVAGLPVGGVLHQLGRPFSDLIKRLHIGFGFQVFGGVANYVSTITSDASKDTPYVLGIHRAEYVHHLKDYVFRPLNAIGTLLDS